MKRFSIAQRLILTFIILSGIVATLGWLGINQMGKLSRESEKIIERHKSRLQTSFDAITASYQNNRVVMQIFLNDHPDKIKKLLIERERNSEQISNYLHTIKRSVDTDREKDLLQAIDKKRLPYIASYVRALEVLLEQGNPEKARKLLLEESIPLLFDYQNSWMDFVEYERSQAEKISENSRLDLVRGRKVFISLTLLAIAISVGIAIVVTYGMNREINTRQKAEAELRKAGEELDERVHRRTAELLQANQKLLDEITQRKQTEVQLAAEQKKFRDILDSCPEGIFRTSPEGRLLGVNQALAHIFKYASPAEMLEAVENVGNQQYANPADRQAFRKRMEAESIVRDFEFECVCKDGSHKWVSITARKTCSSDSTEPYYLGFLTDINEQRKAKQEHDQMEIHLRQAQKLESVGQLAAGIAHEINTPIQYVGDNLRFLEDSFTGINKMAAACEALAQSARKGQPDGELLNATIQAVEEADFSYLRTEIPSAIRQSLDGIQRVANIVGAMKDFSHPGSKEKVPVDINRAIQTTLTVARNEWKYVADVHTEFDPGLPLVPGLPDELNQVFLNLIVNAAQAIGEASKTREDKRKGMITITTRMDQDHVAIRIADTGGGIPEEIRHRIFEPFFTTKDVGKGTGQGLAISRSSVVNKHGGELTFESTPGEGTAFTIRLPLQTPNGKTEAKT